MTAPRARRGSARPPGLVASTRRRNRRLDWLLLRWQARLDARWADRVLPWVIAGILFVLYAALALARLDRLDAGPTLARHVQAAWHLAEGRPPELTVGTDHNLFTERFPALFLPLAALTRVLPKAGTLVVAQAAALAIGVVPLWLLARRVVHLRIGAAVALAFAYAIHPTVGDLDLADFNPQAMALAPLLGAAYFAERHQWRGFAVTAVIAMLWSAELGLVIATMGVVLLVEGERRIGARAAVGGLAWTLVALFAVQAPLGRTGLVAPGAFSEYGAGGLDVLIEMTRNPFRPLADLVTEANVSVLAWVLGPLAFLSLVSPRKLAPALPLTALVLVADVPVTGANGGGRTVPLLAATFVAATFGLGRLGRPSLERVIVDRRLLGVLAAAASAAFALQSPLSPYEEPWEIDRPGEAARREALGFLPPVVAIRVPADLASEVAERRRVEVVNPNERDAAVLAGDVEALILDEERLTDLGPAERHALRRAIEAQGMVQLHRGEGLAVFVRILEGGVLLEGRLPD